MDTMILIYIKMWTYQHKMVVRNSKFLMPDIAEW